MPWEDSTASYIFSHDLENAAVRDGEVDVVSQAVRGVCGHSFQLQRPRWLQLKFQLFW
jgi:hypothetical protein